MKIVHAFVLFLFFSMSSSQASENLRPECEAWLNKVQAVYDEPASLKVKALVLLKGHSYSELIQVLKDFPREAPFELLDQRAATDERIQKKVEEIFSRRGCPVLAYFSLGKTFLLDTKTDRPSKLKAVRSFLSRIGMGDDLENGSNSTLIELMINIGIMKIASDQKLLNLSDALYLKLDELDSKAIHLREALISQSEKDEFQCVEKSNCSKSDYRKIYDHLRFEISSTRLIAREFAWWAKRVN